MEKVKLPLKDGTEYELPGEFSVELNAMYYGVDAELYRMRLWCMANPDRRKTKRGAKRFVFNWVNKACQIKPKEKPAALPLVRAAAEPLSTRLTRLAELKAAIK